MSFPISIIIPSYNGAGRISTLLSALERQDEQNFETIVVIDGSTDDTEEILSQKLWNLNLRVVSQENKGRAGARNAGAKLAAGKILIFYDDDVEPGSDSVSLHVAALQRAPISVGQQLEVLSGKSEFEKYKASISRKWLAGLGSEPIILNKENLFLTAANMSIRAEVFVKLNGFDQTLRDAEDYDLAVRAFLNEFKILFTPANQVTHHSFKSFKEYITRQREYQTAQKILMAERNHDLYSKYHIEKNTAKQIVYFFIPGRLIKWVDKGYCKFIPLVYRHGIYARLVSALSVYYPNRRL